MSYTITQLKTDLEARLHGTSLNRVQNIDGLIDRAAGKILLDLDLAETKRTSTVTDTAVTTKYYTYAAPTDLKGTKVIDIRPTDLDERGNYMLQVYDSDFSTNRTRGTFGIEFDEGVKTIKYKTSYDTDEELEVVYYSKYLFQSSGGTWQETVSDDSDIVNLDTDSYNILLDKCAELCARQIAGSDSNFDYQTYTADYREGVKKYQFQNKSEINKPKNVYYRI